MPTQVIHQKPINFKEVYSAAKAQMETDISIAKTFGISPATLTRWKKTCNMASYKRGQKPLEPPRNFVNYYRDSKAQGKTDLELADECFVSVDTLRRWKLNAGFKKGELNTRHKGGR